MKNSNRNQNYPQVQVRFVAQGDYLLISDDQGQRMLVSANLVRYALGIEYTRKDGTVVSRQEIQQSHKRARQAYIRAISDNEASASRPVAKAQATTRKVARK